MLDIDNNGNIKINAGDEFKVPLFIDAYTGIFNMNRVVLKPGDLVMFNIMEANKPFHRFILSKTFTVEDLNENKDINVVFNSEDTMNIVAGIYFYEIKFFRPRLLQNDQPAENAEQITEVNCKEDYDKLVKNSIVVTIAPRRKFTIL